MDTPSEVAPEVGVGPSGPEVVLSEPLEPEEQLDTLTEDQRRARWQARRPVISHLKDGIVWTVNPEHPGLPSVPLPLFDVGDRIVVDVRTAMLRGSPWLHTVVGKVRSIDDDAGMVSILDEESDPRLPAVRWASFTDDLHIFKLAPAKGDPFAVRAVKALLKKEALAAELAAKGITKRGRGRPPGSKNRSKDVIKAEREAYKQQRAEKKGRRKAK